MNRLFPLALVATCACSVSEGEGEVRSERLFVKNCWDGPFNLQPTFFAANPFEDTMMIRVQRGEEAVEVSDGIFLVVNEGSRIREGLLGQSIELGLPAGVSPPGVPERLDLDPPLVSFALFLYETCHEQNGALYAVGGSITFESLFSGDPNETSAEKRLTEASFEATVVDPRDLTTSDSAGAGSADAGAVDAAATATDAGGGGLSYPAGHVSTVTGNFRFFFERGSPAQPFP